jgi:uncharacterized membrane protein YkvI
MMSTSRIASFLLLASLVGMIAASMIGPKGIYGTQDLERRVEIIENNKSGWNISQTLIGISILLTAAGFAVLGSNLRPLGFWGSDRFRASSLFTGKRWIL